MLRGTLRVHARCAASGSAAAPGARGVAPRRAHGGVRPVRRAAGEGEGAGSSRDDVVKEARAPRSERGSSRHPHAPPRLSCPARAAHPAAPHCARTALTSIVPPRSWPPSFWTTAL